MRLALDTNAYVGFARGEDWAVEPMRRADQLLMPVVVLAELRSGFLWGNQGSRNEQGLTRFLNSKRVQVVDANEETTHAYARLFAWLRNKGTPIPTNDIWIAAVTLQHDAILLSRDAHFEKLPQVALHVSTD